MSLQWSGEQVVAKFPDVQVRALAKHTIQDDQAVLDTWLIEKKNLDGNRKLLK